MEFIKWWERVYTQLFADNAALVGGIIALLLALLFVSLVGYLTLLCVHIVKGVRRRRLARAEIARKFVPSQSLTLRKIVNECWLRLIRNFRRAEIHHL